MADREVPAPFDPEDYRSVRFLEEIEKNPNVSQLPMFPALTDAQLSRVIGAVRTAVAGV